MNEFFRTVSEALSFQQELLMAALIMGRCVSMIVLTPWFGGKLAPTEIKMGLGVLFTLLVWPIASTSAGDIPTGPIAFTGMMAKEIYIGFLIGFVNAHIFYAMEMAGRLIDTVRGSSMSEVMDPHSKGRATPFGDMYSQLMLIVFVTFGGHRIFIEQFFNSFKDIPITASIPMGQNAFVLVDYMTRLTTDVIMLAVVLASPIAAATLISDVVFGILNRVAPQLNAYFMSMPVKAMGGVILALLVAAPFATRLETYVVWVLETVEVTLSLLEPPSG